ncbi:MAG: hypothetical protein D8M57_00690 [Candidatus Scalindua sp. AMX11]|nr:MAG: hypothetical protein DWQ00_18290 [Candidatus Scalindua sp.]NOG86106.1 hypothetical protein [Planctomycetota bacterium]RZV98873.1 MAG: hypothetical protein EX341_00210 [Candidatus Scalindua sp. SCAELEC01]TDE66935.1 MAG: hypothetical protein D8M57_00690 [Candidatus Scalindua sp. AMX11]GJQ57742.1 MAG: hypothetical protein SCALA701_05430 [Candidatus Scalindua sp.]
MEITRNTSYVAVFFFVSLLFGVAYADDQQIETTTASGGNQIVVSPGNILMDIAEYAPVNAYVIDSDGNPIEGITLQVAPQDSTVSIKSGSFLTNEFGHINFFIFGKQEGNTVVLVTDGTASSQVNVTTRNLIHYVLPYFYGNMQLNIINPSSEENFAKVQFYENSSDESGSRQILPFTVRLSGKEMVKIPLAKELGVELGDGWAEILATDVIIGGVWTKKGYLPFRPVNQQGLQ